MVLVFVLVSAYRIYVRQWLEMHWRQSVTARYLERWIGIFMDDATAALDEAMEKRVADGKGCRGHA